MCSEGRRDFKRMDRKIFFFLIFIISCYNPIKKAEDLLKKDRIEEAESVLLYALKKGKKESKIYLLLGEIYLKKKFYLSALKYFEKVLDKSKYKKILIKNLREIYNQTKKAGPEIAKRSLFLLYLIAPEKLKIEEEKALALYFLEKESEEADVFIEKILKKNFDDDLFLKFIKTLFDRNKFKEVISFYKKFEEDVKKSKLYPNIEFYVGSSYFEEGKKYFEEEKIDSSIFYLSKYISMKSPELYLPHAFFLKGKLELLKGDTTMAYYDMRKVLEILPFKQSGIAQEAREILKELKLKGYGG